MLIILSAGGLWTIQSRQTDPGPAQNHPGCVRSFNEHTL